MKHLITLLMVLLLNSTRLSAFFTYGTIPANPTVNDSVYLYCSGTTISSPAWRFNELTILNGFNISSTICWRLGQEDSGVTLYDTIPLGKLASGLYTVVLQRNFTSLQMDSNCASIYTFDYISFNFWVSDTTTAIVHSLQKSATAFLHPSPATTTITLSGTEPGSTATITNLHGQVVLQLTVNNQQQSIKIEHLPPGMYFCTVQSGGQRKVLRFVRE